MRKQSGGREKRPLSAALIGSGSGRKSAHPLNRAAINGSKKQRPADNVRPIEHFGCAFRRNRFLPETLSISSGLRMPKQKEPEGPFLSSIYYTFRDKCFDTIRTPSLLIGGRRPVDGVRGSFSNQKKRSFRLQRSANRDNNDDVDNVRTINQSPHVKGFSFLYQRHLASACQSFPK